MPDKHKLSNSFGETRVTEKQREKLVRSAFKRVAVRYDLMSLGVHRMWKWIFTRQVRKTAGGLLLDLGGGTGDIAKVLTADFQQILIVDPSAEMMQVARKRLGSDSYYIAGAAENIPLPDNVVDVLTISFGIRNTTDITASLREIKRVLKPGGHFYCLEFSTPQRWLRPMYDAWSRTVIPRLGRLVAGHPDAYHYLIESIREFPAQQEMVDLLQQSGLQRVSYRNLSFGIACIHRASKAFNE